MVVRTGVVDLLDVSHVAGVGWWDCFHHITEQQVDWLVVVT